MMKDKTIKNKKRPENFSSTKEPEFMNDIFCLFLKIVNFLIAVYIILSIILYLVIHFNGRDLLKSKKSFNKYDRILFLNLFYDIYLAFIIVISYFSISTKSIGLYVVYWTLMIVACIFGMNGISQDLSTLNNKIRYGVLTLFVLNILLVLYPIFHYLRKIHYFRIALENFPVENIVHEIKLRTDTMKIGFNNLVIKMKLHKILPSITYKKEDYYFLSEECKNRMAYQPLNKDDEDQTQHNHYGSKSTDDEYNRNIDSRKTD